MIGSRSIKKIKKRLESYGNILIKKKESYGNIINYPYLACHPYHFI